MLIFIFKSNHRGGDNSHLILVHLCRRYFSAEMYTYSCMIYIVLLPIDVSIFMPC